MTKGTASMGKKSRRSTLVQRCRRCGSRSYHVRNKKCASCGYGATAKIRRYNWQTKRNGKTVVRHRL
ncbi:50S ribosomal protein L37e [Candidatus Woesearchaeota archaeon]|nr:50S ribosomal protein L37e [Candidatus Woesearchaeota archaeon]HIH25829.1 50S ribosomal protein L37e [Nanoarchaeota archaeon]